MIELQTTEWFKVTGRGWAASIDNTDNQLSTDVDLGDLLGQIVKINGKEYYINGVERAGYSRKYFALLVRGDK